MSLNGCELRFHPKELHYPVICNLFIGNTTHLGKEYKYKSYRWTYAINNGIGCCFLFPNSQAMGFHEGDSEGIVILLDEEERPEKVYFHAHGRGQGMWCDWEDCEKNKDGDLVVYIARYSHASYPKVGVYWRGFGFANDVTSSTGCWVSYEPVGVIVSVATRPLPERSITPFLRFTLPLFILCIRAF